VPELYQLLQKQSLPLESKVRLAMMRIRAWYIYWNGNVSLLIDESSEGKVLYQITVDIFSDVVKRSDLEKESCTIVPFIVGDDEECRINWLKYGCNAFELEPPQCRPLSIWLRKDINKYLESVFP